MTKLNKETLKFLHKIDATKELNGHYSFQPNWNYSIKIKLDIDDLWNYGQTAKKSCYELMSYIMRGSFCEGEKDQRRNTRLAIQSFISGLEE